MPTWQRHKTGSTQVGGFWTSHSEDTFTDNCSGTEKTAIEAAHNSLVARAGINSIPTLRDDMNNNWAGVPINCCFDDTRPSGDDLVAPIFICGMTATQKEVEICRGLASLSSGQSGAGDGQRALDTKAMVFACFGAPSGVPSQAEFNKMITAPNFNGNTREFLGMYVIWNRDSGEVWNRTVTTVQGGFWGGSSQVVSKGTRAFIDASWHF